jgi:catechol 2,3-dioxygenase
MTASDAAPPAAGRVELGHLVLYVRALEESLRFYADTLGLNLKGRVMNGRAALLTGGRTHHELLLIEVGDAPGPLQGRRLGLYHVGWKVGDDLADLRRMMERVIAAGYAIEGMSDHQVSQSLYLKDPDGNQVEFYVDDGTVDWRNDDSWMQAPVRPLYL